MSTFEGQHGEIYYEVHGDADKKPLLILNGIMMSTASWIQSLPTLIKDFRVILVDFYNQGKSQKLGDNVTSDMNVSVVEDLLEEVGVDKINILGISYGGEMSLLFATKHSDKIDKLILSNTTSHTDHLLRHMGYAWKYACKEYDTEKFFMTCMPSIYGRTFYNENIDWLMQRLELLKSALTKEWYDNFAALVDTAENYDCRENLKDIKCETLIISSDEDLVTPIKEQLYLKENIKGSSHKIINGAGHAVMYEAPDEYLEIIREFVC